MKPRRVIVTIETETDVSLKLIKDDASVGTVCGEIQQVQVNVVKTKRPKGSKR
jgi:hypothetical protein